ncbi:hypothetical protein [Subtercola boreus]|uniref:Uncharacterized protein n=1 Tax=Subtercola boreus TaxID=120213 RepID=A0A3E0WF70_9MICO|nr:hypothetical protein [Subtercola boreus]RFA17892.1 hypothetical protein B7R23_16280 [Subtercola boreus]RFA23675.1 hypothetical protein B7R24_02060 [Subtercola boreus]RFA29768.1 hypothetical protein B7R25_02060 [Subtercola boreus]
MSPDPLALPAFIISIIGLVIAVIGAATGVVALVWQIVTRTRGAHRVVVSVNSDMQMVGAGTGNTKCLEILVRNRGAASVQIQPWGIRLSDGNSLVVIPGDFPPPPVLPYTLDAGTSASFYARAEAIADAAGVRNLATARAVVHLATGQKIIGRKGEIRVG